MSIWCSDAQRIIAITQVARGGPGKHYAAKLHDCGASWGTKPASGMVAGTLPRPRLEPSESSASFLID